MVANTTYHFRTNATNVQSREFNGMIRAHLKPGRVLNNLVLCDAPFDLDVARWRATLPATRIDGWPIPDMARPLDRAALENMLSLPRDAERPGADARKARMESYASVLSRTQGLRAIMDDNIFTEWVSLGFE